MFGSLPCFSHISASRDVSPLRITLLIFLCRSINTLMLSNLMTVVLAQGHIPNVMIAIFNAPVRADGAGEGLGVETDLAGVAADLLARRRQAGAGVLLESQARDRGDAGDQRLPLGVELTGGVEDLDQPMLLAAMPPPVHRLVAV